MEEFHKTEMGITAVILGLLPTMLQQIGPSIAEVSVLMTRRPLLAFLLGIAMPSVSTSGPMDDPAEALRRPVNVRLRFGVLERPGWLWTLISVVEYLIAAGAVANVFYQVYQLAYWSVSVSAIAIDSSEISKSYPPFLWLMLLIPAHGFGFWSLKLRYQASGQGSDSETPSRRTTWLQVMRTEFVSCFQGTRLLLDKNTDRGLLSIAVKYMTELSSVVVFIFGTVVLSSQLFISLGDVVPVIARFMVGTLVCRAILMFELHGLREVTSQSAKSNMTSSPKGATLGKSYELISRRDTNDDLVEHVRAV